MLEADRQECRLRGVCRPEEDVSLRQLGDMNSRSVGETCEG